MRSGVVADETGIFPAGDTPEEIEEHLWRIPLPLPFALRSVNVYLIDEGPGARVLIDAGLGLSADETALRAGLAAAGVALEEITSLILTHAHPDHIGLAGPIVAACGASVIMLAEERERMYRVWGADGDALLATVEAMYVANGLPIEHQRTVRATNTTTRRTLKLPPAEAITVIGDGDEPRLGDHSYRAVWTPGHSDYHLCLLRDDGLFLAGDHVLPRITPNIGFYPQARPDPLRDYLGALARVAALPVRLALPGHGRPFADLAGRAEELRAHHAERGERILGLLAEHEEGQSAGQLAGALFGARLRTGDDWRFAVAETLAHLEHLRLAGHVTRHEETGHEETERIHYRRGEPIQAQL